MSERRDPPATPSNTKRCTHCGALNKVDAAWCSQCLQRFEIAEPEELHRRATRQRRKWTVGQKIGVVVAGVLALFGLVVVAYFILLTMALSSWGGTK